MKILLALLSLFVVPTAHAACVCTEDIPTHIEISALYPAPLEGESEWVELSNTGNASLSLANYTLEDETGSPMNLSGSLAAGQSIQISELSFQLNNGGDSVTLKTLEGDILDTLSYSSSENGTAIIGEEIELSSETEEITLWPELSEALPNPEGSDTSEEWIELYNPYSEAINIDGLLLDDQEGGSSPYTLNGSIAAYDYLLISITDSGITLNNSSDDIRLLHTDGTVLWSESYDDPTERESFVLINGSWTWTDQLTPGEANLAHSEDALADNANGDLSDEVKITEIYPDPEGSDNEDEWIEITNGGDESVNLGNWTVDDGEGGSDPYTFSDNTVIEPGETIVIYRSESKIALNNSKEEVRLKDHTGEIVDEVSYEQSVEGQSYAEIDVEDEENLQASLQPMGKAFTSTWEWVKPSPGEPNPSWKVFSGAVVNFEDNLLTLNNGIENLNFDVLYADLGGLIFKPGNTVKLYTFLEEGRYIVANSELLKQASMSEEKAFPWGLIGSIILGLVYVIYEWKKSTKNRIAFSP